MTEETKAEPPQKAAALCKAAPPKEAPPKEAATRTASGAEARVHGLAFPYPSRPSPRSPPHPKQHRESARSWLSFRSFSLYPLSPLSFLFSLSLSLFSSSSPPSPSHSSRYSSARAPVLTLRAIFEDERRAAEEGRWVQAAQELGAEQRAPRIEFWRPQRHRDADRHADLKL